MHACGTLLDDTTLLKSLSGEWCDYGVILSIEIAKSTVLQGDFVRVDYPAGMVDANRVPLNETAEEEASRIIKIYPDMTIAQKEVFNSVRWHLVK